MKENDIFVPKKRKRKPRTTDSRHDGPIAPNLLERDLALFRALLTLAADRWNIVAEHVGRLRSRLRAALAG